MLSDEAQHHLSENDAQASLAKARELMQIQDFAAAAGVLEDLLASSPDLVDALYMLAACLRYQSAFDAARRLVTKMLDIAPEFGRAHQESGHLFRAVGQPERALNAFHYACFFNPMLDASWRAM